MIHIQFLILNRKNLKEISFYRKAYLFNSTIPYLVRKVLINALPVLNSSNLHFSAK